MNRIKIDNVRVISLSSIMDEYDLTLELVEPVDLTSFWGWRLLGIEFCYYHSREADKVKYPDGWDTLCGSTGSVACDADAAMKEIAAQLTGRRSMRLTRTKAPFALTRTRVVP